MKTKFKQYIILFISTLLLSNVAYSQENNINNMSTAESVIGENKKEKNRFFYFKLKNAIHVKYFLDKENHQLIEIQENCKKILNLEKSFKKAVNIRRDGNFYQKIEINEDELGNEHSLDLDSSIRGQKRIRIEKLKCEDENFCKGEALPSC